jgi:DNA-binding NtrC family response regulator
MVCEDQHEASEAARQLLQVNNGSLVTYRRAEDALLNSPAGRVALIILAHQEQTPESTGRMLAWMRRRWPDSSVAVIGNDGGGTLEVTARIGGACYFVRPVTPDQWRSMFEHVMRSQVGTIEEESLGQRSPH